MSRNVLSDVGSDITSTFGGNLGGIEKALSVCTEQVRQRLYGKVEELGGDAVIGLSVDLEAVADKAYAILMAGTVVRSRPVRLGD
jgi:uncharacterized protein YbjQ (UPF0145 family)